MQNRVPPMTTAQYLTAGVVLIAFNVLLVVVNNQSQIFTEWGVRWWRPFELLDFANEQMRLGRDSLPADSIIFPKKNVSRIHVYVIDQTTPSVERTKQAKNFEDFNEKVEELCDSRFTFLQDAHELRDQIITRPFHEAVAFYLVANSLAQHDKGVDFYILDYFGTEEYPFIARIDNGGNQIVNCPNNIRKKDFCKKILNGPVQSLSEGDTIRTDFSTLLTKFQERLIKSRPYDINQKTEVEVTFISDFVHEKSPNKRGRFVSTAEVERKFSELLSACPEIVELNLLKLPMRINDSHLANDQHTVLMSFENRFKNGGTPADLIESDFIGKSSDFIKYLNVYCGHNSIQQKAIRIFVPYNNRKLGNTGKGVFSIFNIESVDSLQFCLESQSLGVLDMELTPYEDNLVKVHLQEKPNLTAVKTSRSEKFKTSLTGIGNDCNPQNLILRAVAPKMMGNSERKYESISLPVQFVPRMALHETKCLGYVTIMILVGAFFWVMLFLSGRAFLKPTLHDWVDDILKFTHLSLTWAKTKFKVKFKLNLLWSLFPTGVCYLLMSKCLPDFPSPGPMCFSVFFFAIVMGYFHLRNLESLHKDNFH